MTLNVSVALVLHVILLSDEDPTVTNRNINEQTTRGNVCFKVSYPTHIL